MKYYMQRLRHYIYVHAGHKLLKHSILRNSTPSNEEAGEHTYISFEPHARYQSPLVTELSSCSLKAAHLRMLTSTTIIWLFVSSELFCGINLYRDVISGWSLNDKIIAFFSHGEKRGFSTYPTAHGRNLHPGKADIITGSNRPRCPDFLADIESRQKAVRIHYVGSQIIKLKERDDVLRRCVGTYNGQRRRKMQ